ncbi:MAG: Holliday junction branch migration DNA helicase RuvB [Candidatus Marinimicrobia bacterium]|nr:Holliday junction branch migration DNA helicase RuvB [Candidatus Neomarinimicrobiota bacterium]
MKDELLNPKQIEDDIEIEKSIRPTSFKDFIGQKSVVENLKLYIKAANERKEPLDHVLLFGPPGLGKTTLAHIIANELDSNIKVSSGPVIERPGDLAGMLTNLKHRDVFFIDEVHRLNNVVEEYLYSAMEDFHIDIVIDKGPNARTIQLNLEGFTLIGATTRLGRITSPLRDRFGVVLRVNYYTPEELYKIVLRSAKILDVRITPEGAEEIAKRARGTPRIANRILKRTRDYAQVKAGGIITIDVARKSLEMLDIDELGLDSMDRLILMTILDKFSGGPVGLNSLAVAVGEEPETIEDVYEPYLIQKGLLKRTTRGREVTPRAYQYFNIKEKGSQGRLFQ